MAGAGFKTFNTGDVLTASDVNTYLMQQTVMVFASAAARTTALGANVAEGMLSYLKDTDQVEVYNGSAWVASDDPNAIQNTIVDAKGDLITATADNTPARLAVGANGYTLVADSSTSTGLAYAGTTNGNPTINSAFQIWQRGTSVSVTTNTATYTADRWNLYPTGTNNAHTVSRQSTNDTTNLPSIQYAGRFQRNSGQTGTNAVYLCNSFETINSIPYAGKTVTFSFYARAGANFSSSGNGLYYRLYSGTGTDQLSNTGYTGATAVIGANATLTTTWQRFTGTGTIATSATELSIEFSHTPSGTAGANDWYEVTGVQIDLGSTALPFRTNGGTIQGELAACQRYYQRRSGTTSADELVGYGVCVSSTEILAPFNPQVTMRVAPTSIEYKDVRGSDMVTTVADDMVVTLQGGATPSFFSVLATKTGAGFTTYRPAVLRVDPTGNGYIGVSAEL